MAITVLVWRGRRRFCKVPLLLAFQSGFARRLHVLLLMLRLVMILLLLRLLRLILLRRRRCC